MKLHVYCVTVSACVCVSCEIMSVHACVHVRMCVCVYVRMCEYVGSQCECMHVFVEHLSVHPLAHWIFLLLGILYRVQLIHLADGKVRA